MVTKAQKSLIDGDNQTSSPQSALKSMAVYGLKVGYSGSKFLADGISTGTSLARSPLANSLGLASGLLSYITTLYFQCEELDERFGQPPSTKPQLGERVASALAWLYASLRCLQKFTTNCFLLGALISYAKSLQKLECGAVSILSPSAFVGVLAYTLVMNIPFMLTNEVAETYENINKMGGEKDNTLDVHTLFNALSRLQKKCMTNFIIYTGAISHSLETLLSMLMLIPPSCFFQLADAGSTHLAIGLTGLGAISALLFSVHLIQTIFFEGFYSEKNMNGHLHRQDNDIPQIHSAAWRNTVAFSSKFLNTQPILHGLEDALPVVLMAKEFGLGGAAYAFGAAITLVSALGTQFSEVWRAKLNTEKAIEQFDQSHTIGVIG